MNYQNRIHEWMLACFGKAIAEDTVERTHRFIEEALELSQAMGGTADDAHKLVDYVFSRPVGELRQECGGVMVTLAALCNTVNLDMFTEGERELARVWKNIEKIREKQLTKPVRSPLPQ